MAKIPVMFKRVSAAFEEVVRARPCESSGSEHSPVDDSEDLSELVDSFFDDSRVDDEEIKRKTEDEKSCFDLPESYCIDSATKEALTSLIASDAADGDGSVKQMICEEMKLACRSLGSASGEGFKRRAMSWLRQRGFDAGLCKSWWEKTSRFPAGQHEYIDIIIMDTRYIVEMSPANEFAMARPTNHYISLLEAFPRVLVCKEGELKQMLRLMSAAMRVSLKKRELHVPPWRRNGYMQAKWFGSYKRTTKMATTISYIGNGLPGKSLVGFETSPVVHNYCRGEVVRKVGLHVGSLYAALNGMQL